MNPELLKTLEAFEMLAGNSKKNTDGGQAKAEDDEADNVSNAED